MNQVEKQLIENSPLLLAAVDASLTCRQASNVWRARLGISENDAMAVSLEKLFADDIEQTQLDQIADVLRTGTSMHEVGVCVPSEEGAPTHGQLSAWQIHPESGSAPWVLLAVTESDELSRLKTTYQLILDAAGEGIYGIDNQGLTTFVNAKAIEILGWRPENVLGKPLHDIHHHSHPDGTPYPRSECPIYAAFKDGEVHRVDDEVFWRTDGTAVPVEYTSTPIRRKGALDGAVTVFRDISQRIGMEKQREAAYEEIRKLKDQLELERDYLRDEINLTVSFGEMIGESRALQQTLAKIEAVAETSVNVLIEGESGVGKEMIARAIHANSPRKDKALVKVNCASIPKELFESEFFGHVKGAFTGAHRDRVGRLQTAAGGTLFLDEVGEIPIGLQSKLLRALQEHEFEKVGDDKTIKVDVRVVAATNRNLAKEVEAGRFREDLFYRLSVFPVEVPPLRERVDDITSLAVHFLESICRELGREPLKLTKQNATHLAQHRWPGNIRELKNVIERAVILSKGNQLRLDLVMPSNGQAQPAVETRQTDDTAFVTDGVLREREKVNMVAALKHANWKISGPSGAAALLGLKASTLTYRMKIFGIEGRD